MKLIEVKESISYILSDIIPVLDKATGTGLGFMEKECFWIAAHFAGGVAFSFALPDSEAISIGAKLLAPVSATSSYTLRHYFHSEFKQNFGSDLANSCLFNVAMDAGFGVLTNLPLSIITGNPLPAVYGAGQGAALSALSCLNTNNGEHSILSYVAANIATAAATYQGWSFLGLSNGFDNVIIFINKAAHMITGVALIHKMVTAVTDQIINNLNYSFPDATIEQDNSNLSGKIEENGEL